MEQAIKDGDFEKIETLLEEGADPNGKIENIPYLFLTEERKIIELLLEYGANIKTKDEYGFTIKDYYDDIEEKKNLDVKKPKFLTYRSTIKEDYQSKRSKTRRAKRSQ